MYIIYIWKDYMHTFKTLDFFSACHLFLKIYYF